MVNIGSGESMKEKVRDIIKATEITEAQDLADCVSPITNKS